MHHHGTDGSCHPGPGGLFRCEACEISHAEDEAGTFTAVRTDEEVREQVRRAMSGLDRGTRYPMLTFEDGASQMLDWLSGMTDEPPFPSHDVAAPR